MRLIFMRGRKDNIKNDLKETVYKIVVWGSYGSAQGPLAASCEHSGEASCLLSSGMWHFADR
jgi:hypothetical protein